MSWSRIHVVLLFNKPVLNLQLIDNSSGIVSLSTTSTTAGIVSLTTSTKAGIVIFSPSTSAQTLTSTTTTTVQPLTPVARRFTYIALRPTPNILTPTNLTQGFPTTTATMSNSLPTTSPMLYNGFTPMSSALQHFRAQSKWVFLTSWKSILHRDFRFTICVYKHL
jgi:hypothetical protein